MNFRAVALHMAAESGNPPSWSWVPKCKEDGGYEPIQCRGSDNTCWCVDTAGNEVSLLTFYVYNQSINHQYAKNYNEFISFTIFPWNYWLFYLRKKKTIYDVYHNQLFKVPGTRSTNSTPKCESPSRCPDPGCNEVLVCAHGNELDENGCPTCECKDPCSEAKCRPDETCELVPLDCEVRYQLILFFN